MHATREDLPYFFGADGTGIRGVNWGQMRSMVVSLPTGADMGPLLRGLPNDLCPCPHWGYVLKGRLKVTYSDGEEELLTGGDLFYMRSGHTAVVEEDVEFVEFSPPVEHEAVLDVVRRNAAAAQSA